MLDLFGKKKQEERISQLEAAFASSKEQCEELSITLEKREERIRRLSAALQEAKLAIKATETMAGARSGAVAGTDAATKPGPDSCEEGGKRREGEKAVAARGVLHRPREMKRLLRRLSAIRSPDEDLLTAYLPGPIPEGASIPEEIREIAASIKSRSGLVILICPQIFAFLLKPPIPVEEELIQEGGSFLLAPIEEMMETPVLVLDLHAGESFVGVSLESQRFEAEEQIRSEVMGRHSKGGWSQRRFERLREEEVKGHLDLVKEMVAGLLERYRSILRYAILSGDEGLLHEMAPDVGLPVVERRLSGLAGHEKRGPALILEEVYGFVCYKIWI